MNVKNSVAAIACVGTLALGYVAGAYIGIPFSDGTMLSGNIKKANTYNKTMSPELQTAVEMLANDTLVQQQATLGSALLYSRIAKLSELSDNTMKATKGIDELASAHNEMKQMVKRAENATEAINAYIEETASIINGEQAPDYEQTQNNAQLSYMVLQDALSICPEMVNNITAYLQKNENKELADLASQWMLYCNESAILANSSVEKAYWQKEIENALGSTSVICSSFAGRLNAYVFGNNDFASVLSQSFTNADALKQSLSPVLNNIVGVVFADIKTYCSVNQVTSLGAHDNGVSPITNLLNGRDIPSYVMNNTDQFGSRLSNTDGFLGLALAPSYALQFGSIVKENVVEK